MEVINPQFISACKIREKTERIAKFAVYLRLQIIEERPATLEL